MSLDPEFVKLDVPSAAAGFLIAMIAGLLLSAQALPLASKLLRVEVIQPVDLNPQARDFVRIIEGQVYVVPADKILVVTSVGSAICIGCGVELYIDGVQELDVDQANPLTLAHFTSISPAPPGIHAHAGQTVEVKFGKYEPDDARAHGYLADA